MAKAKKKARGKRPARRASRSSIVLRWLALFALALVAFLYYRPLQTYVHTRAAVERRDAEVRKLRAERQGLERRLADSASPASVIREARKLSYVKPGERLYIVKGIDAWRHAEARKRNATIGDDG